MSERALAYSTEPIAHRFLVLYEEAGIGGRFANYLLRSLLSEGRLSYETVEKRGETFVARRMEREGPTGLVVTTTRAFLHPENETRLISITLEDSPEQTKAILRFLASVSESAVDVAEWLKLQEWLVAHGERQVTIPYAPKLADLTPPSCVRLRRDFGVLLRLVKTHALLHQTHRGRDESGYIVATMDDYRVVRELVDDLIAEGAEATVPAIVRETVGIVARLKEEGLDAITVAAVATPLGLDKSATLRRVRAAIARGYLVNEQTRRGQPADLRVGDPLPEDQALLPTVEALHVAVDGGCTVADERQGIGRPHSTNRVDGAISDDALFAAWCLSRQQRRAR
jgi:hypothetical protein